METGAKALSGKLITGTSEFKPSPPEKYIYANVINLGVSATDITLDFGRLIVEERNGTPLNVGHGQIAVIMAKDTAKILRDALNGILESDPVPAR